MQEGRCPGPTSRTPPRPRRPALPGSLATLATSWKLSLRAANRAPKTIDTYLSSVRQLIDFLEQAGKPTTAAGVAREHVEAFLADLLETRSAATASVRYRALKVYFSWLEAEEKSGPRRWSASRRRTSPTVPCRCSPRLSSGRCWPPPRAPRSPNGATARCCGCWSTPGCGELADLKVSDVALEDQVALVVGKGRRPPSPSAPRPPGRWTATCGRARHRRDLDWLWLGPKGRFTDTGVRQMVKRRGSQAGIDGLHAHMFRTPLPIGGWPRAATRAS